MTQQTMPSIVDMYEAAAKQTRKIITGVNPHQMSKSTPCSEWNVQALMEHIMGATGFFAATMSGTQPQPPAPGKSPVEIFDEGTAATIKGAKTPGALEKSYDTPFGNMSGQQFMFSAFMDTFVHGWDLAKATGQDTSLDSKSAELIYNTYLPNIDGMRQAGVFGPEVKVPADANIQVKMLGLLGRAS